MPGNYSPRKLTVGSLFSGIGGFDLGMEKAGLEIIWQCEIDKHCQQVLKQHWPNMRLYDDVREINKSNTVCPDVIVGGFPCQDLSVAGKRGGLAGERSGLWYEFHRVIAELKPRWVVIENVPGLLSSNEGRDFATILYGLGECGYLSAWRILDAKYFGVAQQRERVFIVASFGTGSAARVLFEEESNPFYLEQERDTVPAPVYAYKKRGGFGWSETCELALTLEAQAGTHTGGNDTVPLVFTGDLPRWVMPIEAERLQGFPDNHTKMAKDSRTYRYRQLGNAVAVPVARWIGERIAAVEV